MGEEETVTEVVKATANGTITSEQKVEDVPQKKEVEKNGVKEMEDDEKIETQKMDVDPEGKENKETKEEKEGETRSEAMEVETDAKEIKESEEKADELKEEEEMETDAIETEETEEKVEETMDELKEEEEEETEAKETEESEEKVDELKEEEEEETGAKDDEESEEKMDELKEEEERPEESKQVKASKRRGKGRTAGVKANRGKKKVEEKKEQKTPVASVIDRPVRERKSVERLVASIEREYVKEFNIEKGRGTALKDIPNVAYKLSKRKTDDTLKLLHTILFGRRGKAVQVKTNISRFSGFVWNENEEKQRIKVKEKFDKCVKEKLLEFCDVLDMPIAKTTTRKEDIVAKLIDFLVAPHATTTELLAEKEQQSSKGKKRKRVAKSNISTSGSTPSKRSAKSRRSIGSASKEREKNDTPETEDELDEEEVDEEHVEEETVNGVPERSKNEVSDHSESEETTDEFEDEPEEEGGKKKQGSKKSSAIKESGSKTSSAKKESGSKKSSAKKESAAKAKTKKVATPKKSSPPAKRTPVKSSSNRSKVDDSSDASPKTFSRKKRTEVVKEKSSTPKKPAFMEKTGKKAVKGKDKPKENKLKPSDDELKNAICEILKEVDFNTATFTDILKQLAGRFKMDLTPRKSSIKLMIQDELTKLADEADDEEDEGDAEKDEAQPSSRGVEA